MKYILTLSCRHEAKIEADRVAELHAAHCPDCKQPRCAYWFREDV
jgi:hypothetical protein